MDGYDGVTHAGLAIVAADTGQALLAQRSMDPTDAPDVAETWEFPGGSLNPGEDPETAAFREFSEELGLDIPDGEVTNGWRSGDNADTGHYQGFVYTIANAFPLDAWVPTEEVQAVAWIDPSKATSLNLRPEMADFDWSLLAVSGNEDAMTEPTPEIEAEPVIEDDAEPEWDMSAAMHEPIPVHGVVAPEDVATGDGRGFTAGSMTRRPLRLPLSDQKVSVGGHDGSVVVGSVDRLMRKDGMIHWEGALMPSPEADDLVMRMQFFGGKYGVSVDGDNGGLDAARSKETGQMWFDAIRASGLTSVAIPAFHQAYIAFGTNPNMPGEDDETAVMSASAMYDHGDLIGARTASAFGRGPGWVTDPVATNRIHDYWTKKGQPGYAKVGWGTPGDWTRAKALIGAKIAANSPDKMRFLNQIISQWHFDALGYWPGDWDMPGNDTTAEGRAKRAAASTQTALVASAFAGRPLPPSSYFDEHESTDATFICDPDENGLRRVYGYAAEWGVCHIGFEGNCVEPPRTGSDEYPEFHLGITRTADEGRIKTGLLTYMVEHRDAETILAETPQQGHFDNIENAWAAVRVGENERGIWFSGVVLPHVPEDDIVLLEASGQVSGEWKYGAMRTCLTVGVPGFPVVRASAVFDDEGNVVALAASAFGAVDNGTSGSECDPAPTPAERMQALARVDAEIRFEALRANWKTR